jgi:hypothetical protein
VIVDHLYTYLEENELLSYKQFGFRRGRTVEDQLLLTYGEVAAWVDSGFVVDVVLFDFSKAFDVVEHDVLILKLQSIGVGGALLKWIADFLRGRVMSVAVSGSCSASRPVQSGVPQGSVLGPLLFLIYVNYLPHSVVSKCMFSQMI